MPITPDDLIKVLVQLAEEKNAEHENGRMLKSGVVTTVGTAVGAIVGGIAGAGVGALVGGAVGLAGAGVGGVFTFWNTAKLQTVPDFLKPMKDVRKKQLLEHFQNNILVLGHSECSVQTLNESLVGDSEAKSRTMELLKIYFDNFLLMNVDEFAAFQ